MLDQDRGLLYAEACFETVRVVAGAVFRWEAHMARLARGLAAYGLPMPESPMPESGAALLDRVRMAAAATGADAIVRLTVTGGVAARGLMPEGPREPAVFVHAWPWRAAPPARLRSVVWPLPLADRPAKWTSDYAATIRALRMPEVAGRLQRGEEALIVDGGRLVSATTANLALHLDGQWRTPRLGPGVLPGIVRAALLDAGALVEADCDAAMLARCDAMALLSSGAFVRPVASVDNRALSLDEALFAPLWDALAGQEGVPVPEAATA